MTAQFPTVIPVYTNPTSSMTLGSADHVALHSNVNDDVIALATKQGIGASLPNVAGVMRVSNAGTLTTVWGPVVNADVSAAADIAVSKLDDGGTANRVVGTTNGTSMAMTQVATGMIAAEAVTIERRIVGMPSAASQTVPVISTATDVTGATLTFTASAGSVIRLVAVGQFHHSAANGRALLRVADGAGVAKLDSPWSSHATATYQFGMYVIGDIASPGAGSVTYKIQVVMIDPGTLTIYQASCALFVTEFLR